MNWILLIVGIAWLIRMIENLLFHVALWQQKEYRWDRLRAFLSTANGKRLVRNAVNISKFIILILFGSPAGLFLIPVMIILWIMEAVFCLCRFVTHRLSLPVLTYRTLPIVVITGTLILRLYYVIFFRTEILRFDPDTRFLGVIVVALFFDRVLPFWIATLVLITHPFVEWRKRQIVLRATRKLRTMRPKWVIGITGSYGKTSTKEFLAHILSKKFNVLKTHEHVNADIGIARQIIKELKPEHEVYIIEMGAYHLGAIKRDCEMVRPNIGILTAISSQHLALFGSMERLIMAKSELFGALPETGLAIANGDSQGCREIARVGRAPVKFYGTREPADVWASEINMTTRGATFMAHVGKDHLKCEANLIGDWFIPNMLAAITVARHLGISLPEIAKVIKAIPPLSRTMEMRRGVGEAIIIDDSYSANPEGVIAAVKTLNLFPAQAKKILIMPSLIELGKKSDDEHVRIGEQAGAICDAIYLCDQDAYSALVAGVQKVSDPSKVYVRKPAALVNEVIASVHQGDVVLIEGRVPELVRSKLIVA